MLYSMCHYCTELLGSPVGTLPHLQLMADYTVAGEQTKTHYTCDCCGEGWVYETGVNAQGWRPSAVSYRPVGWKPTVIGRHLN